MCASTRALLTLCLRYIPLFQDLAASIYFNISPTLSKLSINATRRVAQNIDFTNANHQENVCFYLHINPLIIFTIVFTQEFTQEFMYKSEIPHGTYEAHYTIRGR